MGKWPPSVDKQTETKKTLAQKKKYKNSPNFELPIVAGPACLKKGNVYIYLFPFLAVRVMTHLVVCRYHRSGKKK
jgi:hypothetical protein